MILILPSSIAAESMSVTESVRHERTGSAYGVSMTGNHAGTPSMDWSVTGDASTLTVVSMQTGSESGSNHTGIHISGSGS